MSPGRLQEGKGCGPQPGLPVSSFLISVSHDSEQEATLQVTQAHSEPGSDREDEAGIFLPGEKPLSLEWEPQCRSLFPLPPLTVSSPFQILVW